MIRIVGLKPGMPPAFTPATEIIGKKMKSMNKLGLAAILALGMAINAHALLLKPGNATWQGSIPNNPDANAVETITGTSAQLTLAYKDNVEGGEEGPFKSSYSTTYYNTSSDPEDARIRYTGGSDITGNPLYLLVKDGNHTPVWYIFDISAWNGTETIYLQDFWPGGGAISHVTIFSGEGTTVPDAGSTLALLGVALTGVGFLRRKLSC
jgi:hypothetical protein